MIIECAGPRCCRLGINRSTSGVTETTNNKAMCTFTFRSLDVALPDKYPKAKCPTAYVSGSSNCSGGFNILYVIYAFIVVLYMLNSSSLYASIGLNMNKGLSCFRLSCPPWTSF